MNVPTHPSAEKPQIMLTIADPATFIFLYGALQRLFPITEQPGGDHLALTTVHCCSRGR